jgi:LCP family protein required for cell wall assembly
VSGTDGTSSSGSWFDQPPLDPYAAEEFTAPITPVPSPRYESPRYEDESPTAVIPLIPAVAAGLSPDQDQLLERLRSRRTDRTAGRRGRKGRRVAVRAVTSAIAFTLVLILTGFGIAGYLYEKYNHQLHRVTVLQRHDPNIREAARQLNAENFLVIGSDSRAGLGRKYGLAAGARSDTTMVVHISPDHRRATVISIPRDSWVQIPACKAPHGSTVAAHADMFNSAFTVGGPACTIATVQKLTGIAVTHFVEIDFSGFKSMVNAIGTVTVCSPETVYDHGSGLRLRAGNNKLNGSQALAYVRARESLGDGSDLGRIKRQQMFLGAVLRQAMSGSMLTNPTRLTSFLDAATKAITIDKDTTFGDLRNLASSLHGLDPKRVTFYTAPIADRNYSPPGTSMTGRVLLDAKQGRALYDSVIRDKKPVWVRDENGTTTVVGQPGASPGPTGATPKPTGSSVPAPNLNAGQKTCSL